MNMLKTNSGNRSLALFLTVRVSITIATQMLTIAIGWQMYALTKSPFYLGLVGLVQFVPMFLLTLLVGYAIDRFDRRLIICICQAVQCAAVLVLAFGSFSGFINEQNILVIVFFIGCVNAFQNPSMQSLLPNIVTKEHFPKATAWYASAYQTAVIVGPALGGFLYLLGPGVVYVIVAVLTMMNCVIVSFVSMIQGYVKNEPAKISAIFGGISFIRSKPDILGAISLDLFAVLFGGATALLPVYAGTILNVGSLGLGLLRSAPAVGALIVSAYLAKRPFKRNVGAIMYTAVAAFGIGTIIFAISTSFVLSLAILAVMGASNVASVVIRSTLVQMQTPDNMRGRVTSVNTLFTGTSNQLGEFESGMTSVLFGGVVPAVVVGGIGTLAVVLLWTKLFPGLYHTDKFKYTEN